MASNLSENKFSGGINKDLDKDSQPKNTLRDAVNIDLVDNGEFAAITNIAGTTKVAEILQGNGMDNINILGAFDCKFNGEYGNGDLYEHDAITIFARFNEGGNGNSAIYIFDTIDCVLHTLMSTVDGTSSGLNFPENGTVDAYYEKDRNINTMIFVDYTNNIRRMNLTFPFLQSTRDMILRPLSGLDTFDFFFKTDDGQLGAGMYQVAYRYFNTSDNKVSAFSPFTNPYSAVPQYGGTPNVDMAYGGLPGEITSDGMWFHLNKTTVNSSGFDAVQLAIIKYIDGSGETPTVAYLTQPSLDWFNNPNDIIYRGDGEEEIIPIEEVVVEDAPVRTFKSLVQKDNRLFGGNVKYNDVNTMDNGNVDIDDAYAIFETLGARPHPYRYPNHIVDFRGYFREEVYRFGIVYHDEFGNFGPVQVLDFTDQNRLAVGSATKHGVSSSVYNAGDADDSTITLTGSATFISKGNLIETLDAGGARLGVFKATANGTVGGVVIVRGDASGLVSDVRLLKGDLYSHATSGTDFKFPARCVPEASILSSGDNSAKSMGFRVDGIKNHPSWARGFAVVRMKRKKDIIFQTPHINTVAYQPVPLATGQAGSTWFDNKTNQTLGIKKFAMGTAMNVVSEDPKATGGLGLNGYYPEYWPQNNTPSADQRQEASNYIAAIPTDYVFNNNGVPAESYKHSSGHKLRIVDAVAYTLPTLASTGASGYTRAHSVDGLSWTRHYYTEEGNIQRSGTNRFYEKIEDLSWFPLVANQDITVSEALQVNVNHGKVTLPSKPFDGGWILSQSRDYGNLTALSQQQIEDPSVSNSNTPNITSRFGNPVENQRMILFKTDEKIEDFSFRMASYYVVNDHDYFPNFSTSNKMISNIYDKTHLADTNSGGNTVYTRSLNGGYSTSRINGGFYIMNVINGLQDDRYGPIAANNEFIFTGHYQPLSDADVDNNTPISADVWGGDCFLTYTAIKINNSSGIPTVYNANEDFIEPEPDSSVDYFREWRLGSYNDFCEFIEYWCESEVNASLKADNTTYPNTNGNNITIYNSSYLYPYSRDYSVENEAKIVTSVSSSANLNNNFEARLVYSDQKVYQTNIVGYDRFRQLSLKDLDEGYGPITKLVKTSDADVYSIQHSAIRYIPVGKEITELQDGSYQVLGADFIIGNTLLYVSTTKGSQHMRSVVSTGDVVYFADADKREINRFVSKGKVETVSDIGMYSFFKDGLDSVNTIPEDKLSGMYDYNKKEYWAVYNDWTDSKLLVDDPMQGPVREDIERTGFTTVFNERLGAWAKRIDIGAETIYGGVFSGKELITMSRADGPTDSLIDVSEWYTNSQRGFLLGSYRPSTFQIIFNDNPSQGKVVDNLYIIADQRLDTMDITILNESQSTPDQMATNVNLNVEPRDGRYVINELRDDVRGGRLRGRFAAYDITIDNSSVNDRKVTVSSILTKYRVSARNF